MLFVLFTGHLYLISGSGTSFFAHACKPWVKQRWQDVFVRMYDDFLSSADDQMNHRHHISPATDASAFPNEPTPLPLWLGTVPLPLLYAVYLSP